MNRGLGSTRESGKNYLYEFVKESNRIEGITRAPHKAEVEYLVFFLSRNFITVEHLEEFVAIYQPGNVLRKNLGQNVLIKKSAEVIYRAPEGGPVIKGRLSAMLSRLYKGGRTAWETHHEYEKLHPFTDGNGRSGRALWLWQMNGEVPLGFLHTFYYQTLQYSRL